MDELIKAIEDKQKERGLNDADLSRLLDIDPSYWCRVKQGERPIGQKMLNAVLREFPTLQDAVIKYMSQKQESRQ